MQAQVLQIRSITHIRRSQSLPVPGNVRVHLGQNVFTGDLLAEVDIPTSHVSVDVVRSLGLSSAAEAEELIKWKVGETLEEKEIIAETGGMFSRLIRTPAPGKIISIEKGVVLIETGKRHETLTARFPGTITTIQKNQRISIEASGSLVQGVWGNEENAMGLLVNLVNAPDGALSPSSFGLEARGTIGLGGICVDEATFQQAASLPVAGLILGSMPARLIPAARKMPFPILVTDGFGLMGMNAFAYRLLSTNHGREVTVNAVQPDMRKGIRPEVFIPLPVEAQPANEFREFKPGDWVRVTAYPYAGQTGQLENITSGTMVLSSGLRAQAAHVKLNQENCTVPLANLEVISIESEVSAETH